MHITDFDHIVWDFNGTLLDDVGIGIRSVNRMLSRRLLPEIDGIDAYHAVFGFPIEDYYRRIGFDFSCESYHDLAHEWVREYKSLKSDASVRSDALLLVDRIGAYGLPQSVLSATESQMLAHQLADLGILSRFEGVCGNDNIYAASKAEMVRAWAEKRSPGRVLMIGDTPHDADVGVYAGFSLALVEGGHASRATLEETGHPVYPNFTALREELFSCI